MQNNLNKDLKNKPLNTKSTAKNTQMIMAESWLKRFSDKHINETDKEFRDWLEK